MISDGHVYGYSRASEVCKERAGKHLYLFCSSLIASLLEERAEKPLSLEMISDRHGCGCSRASEVCKERAGTCLY